MRWIILFLILSLSSNSQTFKVPPLKHGGDKIIHFAAESHVDQSIRSPDNFINSNIIGTYNLLQNSLAYFNALNSIKKAILMI